MRLSRITVRRLVVPLRVPYRLSLGELEAFDTIVVEVEGEAARPGFGEATLLTGYTDETIEGSWQLACELARAIAGLDTADAKPRIDVMHARAPFTATALATAIEMLECHPALQCAEPATVPILGILNGADDEALEREVDQLLAKGFRTFKVKVGFDVESDLAHVAAVQGAVHGRAAMRLDANQGYTRDEARRFVSALDPAGIELFEQPCAADDWEAARTVARASPVPMMLDESIYGLDDIDRAAELHAARYIKVKLMKMGSLDRLIEALARIRANGMEPVLGNGVACEPGCWMEACVARTAIANAGEMNGFLKPAQRMFGEPLVFRDGAIELKRGFAPTIDWASAGRHVVAHACFGEAK